MADTITDLVKLKLVHTFKQIAPSKIVQITSMRTLDNNPCHELVISVPITKANESGANAA